MSRRLAVIVAVACLLVGGPALAKSKGKGKAKRSKRTIAVLEYRSGAVGAAEVGGRLAALLRTDTSHEIIDPDDARRVNPKVDETVAKCGGEPECIAGIGRKLGADEVLLVGVTEIGDLILAIQRVDTRGGKVVGRVADSLAADVEPEDATLEGYLKRLLPPADFLRYGTIRVNASVKGATVLVNGTSRGVTPLDPLTVEAPATLDLRVAKSGYEDFKARIDVVPEGTVEVTPVLVKRAGPWYSKWWIWAVGGALVAGGVTAVILAQPEPSSVPVIIDW